MGVLGRIARELTPPIVVRAVKSLRRGGEPTPEYAYLPGGWPTAPQGGWNEASVADHYKASWASFVAAQSGTQPLYLGRPGLFDHNVIASYNYALARAAHGKTSLSLFDFGGGMGHYLIRSRAAMPDVAFDYHCKDVRTLVEAGRTLLPEATFYSDDTGFERTYDFVLASSSLQYCPDWRRDLTGLAGCVAPGGYLFITRAPTHTGVPTYAFSQNAYDTTYPGWSINTGDLLAVVAAAGARLEREFHLADTPEPIASVPAPSFLRGFLFRRAAGEQSVGVTDGKSRT